MNFESPKTPESTCEILRATTIKEINRIDDPQRIKLLAKALEIRTFMQKTPIRELIVSSIKTMDEDQLKEFRDSNVGLLWTELEEKDGE